MGKAEVGGPEGERAEERPLPADGTGFPEEPNAHKVASPPSGLAYPDDVPDCGLKPYSPLASLSGEPPGRFGEPDRVGPQNFLSPAKPAGASGLSPRIEITPSHELIQAGVPLRMRDAGLLLEQPGLAGGCYAGHDMINDRDNGAPAGYPPTAGSAVLMDALNSLATDSPCGIPPKVWKTSPDPSPVSAAPAKAGLARHIYPTVEFLGPCEQEERRNSAPESILLVPPTWPKQLVPAIPICSIPVTASLPPLEWPLSSHSGSYELRIEVQPKPHHRAHYETEGSRGAVKAPTGGHPVVQVHGLFRFKAGQQLTGATAASRGTLAGRGWGETRCGQQHRNRSRYGGGERSGSRSQEKR
ncbi:Nuclear factor of activated T-cells, cytoplasmic 2 [Fukomys damarensis]|uniref:Nuclear factor of activated T-cells, cytoplasmic 2 n=1 Tax=Fukomys damarensis TaxID=885580 RepID=A0A091DUR5_FUKDA|nr:Nuclear factor of activated T-cells, cytoplasmic 2 [Fukomys damarensis]